MPSYTPADLRNILLAGHAGSGKTTLAEAMLHKAGVIGKMGSVEEGNTVCDFEEEEKHHKHSLYTTIVHFEYEGKYFDVLDTPGTPDFIGQAFCAFPAVETCCLVIGADKGIGTMTRRLWRKTKSRNMPTMIVVNKMDDHIGDCEELLAQIRETFGPECLPANLPTPDGSDVVDLWEKTSGEVAFSSVEEAHTALVDQVVEVDEDLMATYLEQGQNLKPEQLHDAFEEALRQAHIVPVFFVSALTGAGLDKLMHALGNLCPSPEEGNPRPFLLQMEEGGEEKEWVPTPKADETFVGHIYKVTTDQFVGKLALMRVHQGTIKAGDQVYLNDGKKAVRVAHLYKVQGKEHTEVPEAIPGDNIALAKIEELHYDAVLHASTKLSNLRFKSVRMPVPMYGVAIEPKSRGDEAKINEAMAKLREEDPTFRVERVSATKQTVAHAMGELHLRVILERLHNRFKLDLVTEPPKVAYRETITAKAEGHHRHKKQTGGAGQFGEVFLRVEPWTPGEDDADQRLLFVDATVGGSVPRQFMPAIEKGVRQVLEHGAVAGYPISGVKVEVYDGKHHPVDSKEVAFVAAGKRAFIDAVSKAKPILLEPFVEVEVTAPASAMGDISADFSSKRGQVMDSQIIAGDQCVVKAKAPLSEMNNYSSQLKSITGGQGSYTMDYSHDERTPPNIQQEIIAAFEGHEDDD
ncbi:MAG: elongation factor G [Phycisphaerales bacterium]